MKVLRWLPACIIILFIFYQSSLTRVESNGVSLHLLEWIYPLFFWIEQDVLHGLLRKSAHFTEFFILGLSLHWPLSSKQIFIYGLFCLLVPACDEMIQYFTPGRAAMITDCMIDASGMICAWLAISTLTRRKKHHEQLEP